MLFLWLALISLPAEAKNFALVLGGFGVQAPLGVHDFIMPTAAASLCLQSSGYDVRTLIGAANPETAERDNAKAFAEDYGFLKSQKIPYTPATTANIEAELGRLVTDVKEERKAGHPVQVEMVVNAHGLSECEDPSDEPRATGGVFGRPPKRQECGLYIQVFDGQQVVNMKAKVFESYVRELREAGAHVNLNFNNCNAGASKDVFDKIPGVCTYYGSVDNTKGTGCTKGVPEDVEKEMWNSNTYVNMFRSCNGHFDELLDPKYKGYFADNGCFTGLKKHLEEKKIDLGSVASAYFSERRESASFEASALSCFELDAISSAGFARDMQDRNLVCQPKLDLEIEKLMGHLQDALLTGAWAAYDRSLAAYNRNLGRQLEILPSDIPRDSLTQPEARKLAALEKEMETISAGLIAAERALFDRYYELEPGKFSRCREGACGLRTGGKP